MSDSVENKLNRYAFYVEFLRLAVTISGFGIAFIAAQTKEYRHISTQEVAFCFTSVIVIAVAFWAMTDFINVTDNSTSKEYIDRATFKSNIAFVFTVIGFILLIWVVIEKYKEGAFQSNRLSSLDDCEVHRNILKNIIPIDAKIEYCMVDFRSINLRYYDKKNGELITITFVRN